jgi:serine/threonine protein kinase
MASKPIDDISLSALRLIDSRCDQFEAALRRGERPRIEDFLNEFEASSREVLLQELIRLDIEHRRRQGECPTASDYECFPAPREVIRGLCGEDGAGAVAETVAIGQENGQWTIERPQDNLNRVLGSYRLTGVLGGGGMGTVYRARHTLIDCERAVKLLKPGLAGRREANDRFLREAQAAIASLSHPNIVKAFDVGSEGNEIYLVMELVDGLDLSQLVAKEGPQALDRAVQIIEQAAAALAFAHAAGFIHRDIKPQNLMVARDGSVKILDLGLVRMLEQPAAVTAPEPELSESGQGSRLPAASLTDTRSILGTLNYLPPEQAKNSSLADARSDIYSLGCTLYFLLTGMHAFAGGSAEDVLRRHQLGDFKPPRSLRPQLPPSLEAIVVRMMKVEPEDRYADAAQVARALRAWRLQDQVGDPSTLEEPLNYETREELQEVLTRLGIISLEDWQLAEMRLARFEEGGERTPEISQLLRAGVDKDDLRPMIYAFEHLYRDTAGRRGLSDLQRRHISLGNADLLRMPQHVICDRIGAGWKGEVFRAREVATGETAAIRTFSPDALLAYRGDHPHRLQAFMIHGQALAALDHPVFSRIRSFDCTRNRVHKRLAYIVCELIPGRSAHEILASPPWKSDRDRLAWSLDSVSAIAAGLAAAHAQGILHLDLHGGVAMITEAGEVRVIDVGIAQMVIPRRIDATMTMMAPLGPMRTLKDERWTRRIRLSPAPRTEPLGTPAVMPPEQWIERSDVSPAVDVYNLGCLLCLFLTGRYPFEGESVSSFAEQHLGFPAAKSQAVRKVHRQVRPLIEKMLAKEPVARPESAAGLADEFSQLRKKLTGGEGWLNRLRLR